MSGYIRREDVLGIISSGWSNHYSCKDMCDEIIELPTLDETEIIRKAFERVVERLEEKAESIYKDKSKGSQFVFLDEAIEIVKEECGINE